MPSTAYIPAARASDQFLLPAHTWRSSNWAVRTSGRGVNAAVLTLRHVIWGTSPADPATFITVALVMLAVVAMASFLPARRATRLDPARTLRVE